MSGRNGQGSESEASTNQETYDRLRELIVTGSLAPGSRIVESDLSRRLGVSRTPVRAALFRLQQEGYVYARSSGRKRQTWVSPLRRSDVRELLMLLGAVERIAVRQIAGLPDDARLARVAELKEINDAFLAAATAPSADVSLLLDLDRRFHSVLTEDVVGDRIRSIQQSTAPHAERYIRVYFTVFLARIAESAREHADIVDALEKGDADAAMKAIEANWCNAADRVGGEIERMGGQGDW